MRKILLALSVCALLSVTACKEKDKCESTVCPTSATCNDGNCICPANATYNSTNNTCNCNTGYEGSDCTTLWREKYIGTWQTNNESCTSGGPSSFNIVITTSASETTVSISNLYGGGFSAIAVIGQSTITINNQPFGTGSISGSGTISGNTITLNYAVAGGGATDVCNSVTFNKI